MGLTDWWSRAATSRAHVLVAEAPGAFAHRVAFERALSAAGWCRTDTAADADVLAVLGQPGPELLAVIDHAWCQMSEPRARIELRDGGDLDLPGILDRAREVLRATGEQRTRALGRPRQEIDPDDDSKQHAEHEDHEDHGDHDHGAMSPDGIALAEGAEDRDGLEMDELHLPLGPVLTHWPAGVVLRLALHGDVVSGAEVERLDAAHPPAEPDDGPTRAARLLDAASSVLTLAGLPAEAARAARLRERCLTSVTGADGPIPLAIDDLATRLGRHRVLRWMLRDLAIAGQDGRRDELHDHVVGLLERARAAVTEGSGTASRRGPSLEALPDLVRGQELAAVRLWMAALSADLTSERVPGLAAGV